MYRKKNKAYPLYESLPMITDLKDMMRKRLEAAPDAYAFGYSEGKTYVRKTTSEFCRDVNALGTYLLENGYGGKHVAIIGENSYEWLVTFFALVNGGCVAVPIDKEYTEIEVRNLLKRSDCSAVMISKAYRDLVLENNDVEVLPLCDFNDFVSRGEKLLKSGTTCFVDYVVDTEALCAIFFTSGTTGINKGVMLSHKNIAADINAACKYFYLEGDTMCVLPFHHTLGLTTAICMVFHYRKGTYINKSLKRIKQDLALVKPYMMFMVPLFVETFYKQILDNAKKSGQYTKLQNGMKLNRFLLRIGIDKRKKMFASVQEVFGGNLEYILCGGAPLQQKYIDDFENWGITILNGYGITECSPVLSINRSQHMKSNSVGLVLDGIKIQSDSSGELLVKGDNVMLGYYKDQQATAEALDNNWYHTGDLGYVDEEGFLFLTGRKKNLIILSNGENVSPEEIEAKITKDEAVEEVVVYEEEGLIVAEIFPRDAYKGKVEYFESMMENINKGQPKFKQVAKVKLREKEFIKNATKKIVRYKIKEEHENDK